MTAADDLNLYLDTMFGENEGYLHVATGWRPHFNAAGKYKHDDWRQEHYRWPEEREQAVRSLLADAQGADAYVCPYLMVAGERAGGAATERRKVHADIDGGFDAGRAAKIGACAVGSGTPGHAHAYVGLSESVPAHWHTALCRGLGAYLGDADAKISDNDVLRPPGTLNHKARARSTGSEATPVEWLIRPDGTKWEPQALAQVLGITLPAIGDTGGGKRRATKSKRPGDTPAGDQVDLGDHPKVQAALANNTGDRSADTMRVIGACVSAKLTRAQGRWVVNSRPDLAERLAERPDDDFTECWLKAVDSRQEYARQRTAERERAAMKPDGATLTEEATDVTHSGHLGMAYKVGAQYRDKLLYVNGIGWHRWDGTRWAKDDNGAARRAVHTVIKREWIACANLPAEERDKRAQQISRYETASAISGILTESAALEVFSVTVNDLDADPYLINCANGTLDLHTLVLRPASPADRITKVCRGAYTPDAAAPVWNGFLGTSLPDGPVRQFVQRLVGLALLGEVREHLLPIFTGEGANGKSTFYEGVLHTLGDYGIVAEADLFNHRENAHPTGQMDLMGRRLAVISETDEGKRLAEATVKRLTGGDPIRARYMRENFVQFNPSHLPILVTNHLPKVSGDDPAIWRRLRVVDWTVVIPPEEQDKELARKLQLEADGILSWAVEGLRDYLAGGLAEPESVIRSTSQYRADSDAVARFVDEVLHRSPAVKINATDLFEAWDKWRRIEGAPEVTKKALGQSLIRHGFESSRSNSKTWWHGLCIVEEGQQCM